MQAKVNIHIMRTRGLVSALTVRVGLEESKSRGLTYYWSDKVCKRGHDGWRYVSQPSACRACVRMRNKAAAYGPVDTAPGALKSSIEDKREAMRLARELNGY